MQKNNLSAKAVNKNVRSSPRKISLILNFIKGKKADTAIKDLEFTKKKAASEISKTVKSAIANAENNNQLDIDNLFVKEAYVGKSIVMKRFRPRAKGRASPILKPYSRVTIILEEKRRLKMGQKINPIGLRLGINRGWDSTWFAKKKDFGKFLIEDFKIRKYIKKNITNSGVSEIVIERSSKKCIVSIHTSRPGFVIGKKGADIEKIKKNIMKITDNDVTVNIKEIKKPELNANLVAENIAQQLVKRVAYRRAMKRSMQSAMRLSAKGIKVMVSGRLAGNEIARTEWLREGSIPSHTLRANIDYGFAEALTTYGIIGVKVWIYKGELFDKDVEREKTERVKNVTANKN